MAVRMLAGNSGIHASEKLLRPSDSVSSGSQPGSRNQHQPGNSVVPFVADVLTELPWQIGRRGRGPPFSDRAIGHASRTALLTAIAEPPDRPRSMGAPRRFGSMVA